MPRPNVTNKTAILDAAIPIAARVGFQNVRRIDLAQAVGVAEGTVSRLFSTMTQLRRAMMGACIAQGLENPDALRVLAQGLAVKDPRANAAPQHLKDAAAKLLTV